MNLKMCRFIHQLLQTTLVSLVLALIASVVPLASVGADPVPSFGYQWSTIGARGNRPANAEEAPLFYDPGFNPQGPVLAGAVAYEYRLARTEVTVAQWSEFVQAYAPYYTGPGSRLGSQPSMGNTVSSFTGEWIFPTNGAGDNGQPWTFVVATGSENLPASMSWHFAARFCNWLHNGKALTRDAFESGVYDTSTFTLRPDGRTWNDQIAPAAGARFWIPTFDEWTKGMYYDPQRYGDGVGGYWLHPTSSNALAIPGLPEQGGQTSAGLDGPLLLGPESYFPVGSYPNVQSPWGLLDGSGGVSELTSSGNEFIRISRGSSAYSLGWVLSDRLDDSLSGGAPDGGGGLRLASIVPSPGCSVFLIPMIALTRRKR